MSTFMTAHNGATQDLDGFSRARTLNEGWDGTQDRVFRLKHGLQCVRVVYGNRESEQFARSAVPSQA